MSNRAPKPYTLLFGGCKITGSPLGVRTPRGHTLFTLERAPDGQLLLNSEITGPSSVLMWRVLRNAFNYVARDLDTYQDPKRFSIRKKYGRVMLEAIFWDVDTLEVKGFFFAGGRTLEATDRYVELEGQRRLKARDFDAGGVMVQMTEAGWPVAGAPVSSRAQPVPKV